MANRSKSDNALCRLSTLVQARPLAPVRFEMRGAHECARVSLGRARGRGGEEKKTNTEGKTGGLDFAFYQTRFCLFIKNRKQKLIVRSIVGNLFL